MPKVSDDASVASDLARLSAAIFDAPARDLVRDRGLRRRATRNVELASMATAYVANSVLRWNYTRVGDAMGRDRSVICRACRRVEDLREDRIFDRRLKALEAAAATISA